MLKVDVDFTDYCNDYCMGQEPVLSAEQFAGYINRARLFLRSVMNSEYKGGFDEEAKACLCAIAEQIYIAEKKENIKSEDIDGYSVTYERQGSIRTKLLELVALYLEKSGLLFAGVE